MALFTYPNSEELVVRLSVRRPANPRSSEDLFKEDSGTRGATKPGGANLEEDYNSIKKRGKPKSFAAAAEEYLEAKALTLKASSLDIEKRGNSAPDVNLREEGPK